MSVTSISNSSSLHGRNGVVSVARTVEHEFISIKHIYIFILVDVFKILFRSITTFCGTDNI